MAGNHRTERVKEYQRLSEEADELASQGRKEKTLEILRRCRENAEASGDEDYRLFFEAELSGYTQPDYDRQIGLLGQAMAWQEERGIGPDAFLYRSSGVYFSQKEEYGEAIKWFDKALEINPSDFRAMRQKGVSLGKKGEYDEAIKCFDEALKINPNDYNVIRHRGVSLSKKGEYDEAIKWFQKALRLEPNDSSALRNWAVSEYYLGHFDETTRLMREAAQIEPARWRADFRLLCELTQHDFEKEWRSLFPDAEAALPAEPQQQLTELSAFIKRIRNAYTNDTDIFLAKLNEEEGKRKEFLDLKSNLAPEQSVLLVLRQWNSYTPAIPQTGDERSRGGGYFLWDGGKGTVIDPGYNFIENLNAAGCRMCDIDNIVLTHAHNDHTIEFETLCALLHEHNDLLRKKNIAPKKVRMYMSNGAFMKFAGMLNLRDADYTEHVFTLNADTEYELGANFRMRVLNAYHDDLIAQDQSVGLFFRIEERTVLLTSDTGLFPLDKSSRKLTPNTTGPEIWERYPKTAEGTPERPDLMIVHIGSIKETELKIDFNQDPKEACYPNHLGIIGTARVITQCRPRLAVVSEFGEEMKQFRLPLMKGLQENVINSYCQENGINPIPRVIPGDLPFIYNLKEHKVYCCASKQWQDADDIQFESEKADQDREHLVYYFGKEMKARFDDKANHWANAFQTDRKGREGMYFKRS